MYSPKWDPHCLLTIRHFAESNPAKSSSSDPSLSLDPTASSDDNVVVLKLEKLLGSHHEEAKPNEIVSGCHTVGEWLDFIFCFCYYSFVTL